MTSVFRYVSYLAILIVLAIPMGACIKKVMYGEKTFLSKILPPCEDLVYKFMRVKKDENMRWKEHSGSVLYVKLIDMLLTACGLA